MVNKKQVHSFFKEVKQKLKEDFETKYGFTDKKRKIDTMINKFPNGIEVVVFNIKDINESDYSMVIKYDSDNIDKPLKFHGYHNIKNQTDLRKLITKTYGIKWPIKTDNNLISTGHSVKNCHYIYMKNKDPLSDTISFFFNLNIIMGFNQIFELSVVGVNDQIHSIRLKKMTKKYSKILKLPSNKSFIIFDLPFEMKLSKDRYKFFYKNKEGELRFATLLARYGNGKPPIMGEIITGIHFTRVIIIYPFKKNMKDDEIIINSIDIMNEAIEAYRVVTNHYFIPNVSLSDITQYHISIKGKGSTMGAKIRDTYSPYFKYQDKLNESEYSPIFSKYLSGKKTIPLQKRLISNSKRHFYYQNYQYSIFEAVLALEIAVSNLVRKKYEKLGLSKNQIDNHLIRTGFSSLINNTVPLIISQKKRDKLNQFLPMCLDAIKMRNAIAHKGLKDFRTKQVANYIKAIEGIINII